MYVLKRKRIACHRRKSYARILFAFSARLRAVYLRLTLQKRDNNEVRKLGCDPVPQNQIPGIRSSGSYLSGHSCRWMPLEWAKCAWPVFRVEEKSKWDLAINRSSKSDRVKIICEPNSPISNDFSQKHFLVQSPPYCKRCMKQFFVSILNIILI